MAIWRACAFGIGLIFVSGIVPVRGQDVRETEQVTVIEVPIQIFRRGKPLSGLTKDNFRLKDNGQPQQIINVEELDFTDLTKLGTDATAYRESERRHFLFFFDYYFASMPHILRARDAVREMLYEPSGPDDRFAICLFLPSTGPIWLSGFTSDTLMIEVALDTLEAFTDPRQIDMLTAPGNNERLDKARNDRYWFEEGNYLDGDYNVGLKLETRLQAAKRRLRSIAIDDQASRNLRDLFADMQHYQNVNTPRPADNAIIGLFSNLPLMAHAMRELPGAKYMVLFSGGFSAPMAGSSAYGNMNQSHANRATEIIRQLGWQIHTVNIAGTRDGNGGDLGLNMLAEDTGGIYYQRFNDLEQALQRFFENTAITYLLTYQPNNLQADGSYHEIELELVDAPRRAKIRHHREGYYAPFKLRKTLEGTQRER